MDPIFKMADIVADRLKYHQPYEITVVNQKVTEREVIIGFKYEGDSYEYKLTHAGVTRKIEKIFLNYTELQRFEEFFEDLRARLFSKTEPGQVSMFDNDVETEDEHKKITVVSEPDKVQEKEFAEEVADEVIDAEFNEKPADIKVEITDNDVKSKISYENEVQGNEKEKDEYKAIEDKNVSQNALNEEIENKSILENNPLKKKCVKCGIESYDLDVNDECEKCAAEDADQVTVNLNNSPFGETTTLSFN